MNEMKNKTETSQLDQAGEKSVTLNQVISNHPARGIKD